MRISIWLAKQALRITESSLEFTRNYAITFEPNEVREALDDYLECKAYLKKLQDSYDNGVYYNEK